MIIEVSTVSVSKKGTVWLMVKVVEGDTPRTGDTFECKPHDSIVFPKEKKAT